MTEVDEQERRYEEVFRSLKSNPDVVQIGYVYIDIPATIDRSVACSEGLCMSSRKFKKLKGKTCCTTFNVPLETEDVERLACIVDEVKEIRDVGKAIEKAEGWWRHDEDGLWLEDRPSGACVFLSVPPEGPPLCTIHEWALTNGLEFRDYKPETCCLFPLYLAEQENEYLVTGYGSRLMLALDEDESEDEIENFACLCPAPGVGKPLLVEQQQELEYRLGKDRWGRVLGRLREMGHPV